MLSLSLPASALPQRHRQCHIMLSLKVDLRNSPNGKSTQNTAMHITIVSLRPQLNKSYPQKLPQESKTSVTKPKKKKQQPPTLLFGHHHLHHHITRANMFAHIIHLNKKQTN